MTNKKHHKKNFKDFFNSQIFDKAYFSHDLTREIINIPHFTYDTNIILNELIDKRKHDNENIRKIINNYLGVIYEPILYEVHKNYILDVYNLTSTKKRERKEQLINLFDTKKIRFQTKCNNFCGKITSQYKDFKEIIGYLRVNRQIKCKESPTYDKQKGRVETSDLNFIISSIIENSIMISNDNDILNLIRNTKIPFNDELIPLYKYLKIEHGRYKNYPIIIEKKGILKKKLVIDDELNKMLQKMPTDLVWEDIIQKTK